MKVGLNLRKVDLEVGLTPEDEERMEETIIPSGVLSHVGPVDVCRRLMKRLRKSENARRGEMRVHDYGYDWRLSPELLSRRLISFLESLPCNQEPAPGQPRRGATVIAHSLGGLITRHAVNERPDLFAGVVYAGVPQHCVNILGPLRNGDDVLLSSRVLTAQVNFTFRTSFALLPEDGHCFIDKQSKKEFRIDFFDAKTWEEHRLSPCMGPALPVPPTNSTILGFKDIPILGKRFSMGLRDDSDEFLRDPHDIPQDSHAPTAIDKGIQARNANTPHNPAAYAAYAAEKAQNPADGLVGPGAHPRSSAATSKIATTSTIPRAAAKEYLQRTLADTKRFKENLAFRPSHHSENRYPPAAVLYGKTLPTVYGARVVSRESIKQVDAYDDLAFAAGDGVCLASAAMLPPGYRIIKDGLVKSDRGHVGLLGDLEGVGQCLRAVQRGRKEGVGLGEKEL
jgi:pimeloyl-ACP methyl ester carboxylesterase